MHVVQPVPGLRFSFFYLFCFIRGTGLRLAVVLGIVNEYGGDIQVIGRVGHGSVFHVYLPLVDATEEAAPADRKDMQKRGDERILLIDDEVAIVRLETQMLERFVYQVRGLSDPLEALALFQSDPTAFDVVITDMAMPHMTGQRLAVEFHKLRPDLPVILCTGFSETIDQQPSGASGIQGYLMKPVVMQALAGMVRQVLDKAPKTGDTHRR
jgi:CheY-like chemotaxis protein